MLQAANQEPVVSQPPVDIINMPGTYLVKCDSVPWTPFVFPKTYFKLLAFNDARASVSILVLAEKDAPTPIHKHLGAAEIFMLKGSLSYEEGTALEGDYLFEAGGTVHIAEAKDEVLSLVIFHGPLMGYNDDGSVAGVCDVDLFYKLAADNNAVGHLPPR